MKKITLEVDDELASIFETLTPDQKQTAARILVDLLANDRNRSEAEEGPPEYFRKQNISVDLLEGLNSDVVKRLFEMAPEKRALALKFIADLESQHSWKELFIRTAEQAQKQGLTEDKLRDLLNDE